jgi:hypothetical protein
VSDLAETRWTRYGKDRVYVRTSDGVDVGYVDLLTRSVHATLPQYADDLAACLARWSQCGDVPRADGPDVANMSPAPVGVEAPTVDLALNVAGGAARATREEVNSRAPVFNLMARVFRVHTPERAWRVGAKGEEKVGKELAKLGPGWRVLHAVQVGDQGSDIDHVVIGPAGVFTLNTKRHPRAKAWVGERAVMVNGRRTHYLRNSRFEAHRAERLLSSACGVPVAVRPVIVFVDLDDIAVKQMPADVQVLTRRRLLGWLSSVPSTISAQQVDAIYAKARVAATWRTR